jgi:hypothetical protein
VDCAPLGSITRHDDTAWPSRSLTSSPRPGTGLARLGDQAFDRKFDVLREPTITAKEPTDDADGNLLTDCELAGDAIGGEGQNRTVDTVIFSHVLYQLSYLAPEEFRAQKRRRS